MDQVRKFHRQLSLLQAFIWIKRSVRLLIRSIWLGVCGYLLGWGLYELRGWFSDDKTWLLLSAAFAALPIIGIIFSWPTKKRMVWSLDRKLELKEQISTAWSATEECQENVVVSALLDDVLGHFPRIWKRLLLHGWHISRDLLALSIVLILSAGVYVYRFLPVTALSVVDVTVALLSPLGTEASADDIFPAGLLGLKPTPTPLPGQGGTGGNTGSAGSQGGNSDAGILQKALSNMGEQLSKMAATYELGQALQSGDIESAATATENLADHVDDLDTSTKEFLTQAMYSASKNMSTAQGEVVQELSQDLSEAASQIQKQLDANRLEESPSSESGSSSQGDFSTQDMMDELASDFRALGALESETPGGGASGENTESEQGNIEPAVRIQGESDVSELELSGALQPGMLTPANTQPKGYQSTNEPLNLINNRDSGIVNTPLIPSFYPWKWRNVVSTYFLSR